MKIFWFILGILIPRSVRMELLVDFNGAGSHPIRVAKVRYNRSSFRTIKAEPHEYK